jgi:hypothetical protein
MAGEEKKRGGCLVAFLIFTAISNVLSVALYLFQGDMILQVMQQAMPLIQKWYITASIIIAILAIAFVVTIWFWRKIGVYGIAAITVAGYMMSVKIGVSVVQALSSFITLIILILLVRPIWKYMK